MTAETTTVFLDAIDAALGAGLGRARADASCPAGLC